MNMITQLPCNQLDVILFTRSCGDFVNKINKVIFSQKRYMNILVTIKNEYLIRIKNLLTKIIYDGLNSIYVRTREVSNEEEILKTFQSLLKRVPKWTDEILSNEVLRIRSVLELDNKYDLLSDLIKASIKSHFNIMTFGFDPEYDVNNLINNFSFKDFIKNVYIEKST